MAKLNTSTSKKRGRREIRSYWNRDILITTRPLRSTEDLDEPPVKIRCDYPFAVARRNFKVFATLCANEHKLGMSLRSRRLLYRSMFGIRCLDFQRKVEIARVILGPIPGDKKKGNRYSTEMSSDSSDSDMEWNVSFGGYVLRAPGPEKLAMVPEPAKVEEEHEGQKGLEEA